MKPPERPRTTGQICRSFSLALAYGAQVDRATHLVHGKTSRIDHTAQGVFAQMPEGFRATRYHSLIVNGDSLPSDLQVTATSEDDGYVMGLRHQLHPVESVQFHPESITTERGAQIFQSFLDQAQEWSREQCTVDHEARPSRNPRSRTPQSGGAGSPTASAATPPGPS